MQQESKQYQQMAGLEVTLSLGYYPAENIFRCTTLDNRVWFES